MQLHEQEAGSITDVLAEEPEAPGAAGSAQQINSDDFSITSPEIPKEEKETATVKKETVTTSTNAAGEKVIEKVVVQQTGPTPKGEAMARLLNPKTALLVTDMFMTKMGAIFTPERTREYWTIHSEDKAALEQLLTESAKEEGWTGIPSKYLLLGGFAMILGGKIAYAKKPEYKFVPGERDGDPKKENASGSNAAEEKIPQSESEYKALFIREKARYEAEMGFKSNNEMMAELKKQNDYLRDLLEDKLKKKTSEPGISDVDFEEVRTEIKKTEQKKIINDVVTGDTIFKASDGSKWNLDKIAFTEKGARFDETKAGTYGWSITGVRLGQISRAQVEAFNAWKEHKKKRVAA